MMRTMMMEEVAKRSEPHNLVFYSIIEFGQSPTYVLNSSFSAVAGIIVYLFICYRRGRNYNYNCNYNFFQKVNIDIGTKILKQKCFGSKTNVFNTHSNFPPAIEFQISSSIRISYSRSSRNSMLMRF